MIESVKITSGYAIDVEAIGKKTFKFTKGLNVVYGPNGCGKSTLLGVAAAYCGCNPRGGWSTFIEPSFGGDVSYPHRCSKLAPGRCKANVQWDGTPTFLHNSRVSDAPISSFDDNDSDGVMSPIEKMVLKMHGSSAGQARIASINVLLKKLESFLGQEDMLAKPNKKRDKVNVVWERAMDAFTQYAVGKSLKGPMTVILDEPDRSFDANNQWILWSQIIPRVAKDFQLIVATHSPFALACPDVSVIDMLPGYAKESIDIIHLCSKSMLESSKI